MIYKTIFIYTLGLFFICGLAHASCEVLGVKSGNRFNGMSLCSNVTFNEKISFNGASNITNSLFQAGAVFRGAANISTSIFKQGLQIKGVLTANDSKFQAINILGSKLNLFNSEVYKQITLNHHSFFTTPKIIISGKSIIHADIKFVGSKGEVTIDKSSKLLGKVINGTIVVN